MESWQRLLVMTISYAEEVAWARHNVLDQVHAARLKAELCCKAHVDHQ